MLYGQAPLPASAGSFRSRILSVASGTEKQNLPAIFASRKFFESGRIATLLRTKLCERHERDPQADKVLVYSIKDGRPVPNAQVQHELSVIPVIIQNLPVFVSLQQGSNRFPNMYKPAETVSKSRKKTRLYASFYMKNAHRISWHTPINSVSSCFFAGFSGRTDGCRTILSSTELQYYIARQYTKHMPKRKAGPGTGFYDPNRLAQREQFAISNSVSGIPFRHNRTFACFCARLFVSLPIGTICKTKYDIRL